VRFFILASSGQVLFYATLPLTTNPFLLLNLTQKRKVQLMNKKQKIFFQSGQVMTSLAFIIDLQPQTKGGVGDECSRS